MDSLLRSKIKKIAIITFSKQNLLDKRSKLILKYRHKNNILLCDLPHHVSRD